MIMVLAWQVKEFFEKRQMDKGAALWQEAVRQSEDSGESPEEAYKRLKDTGWKPTQEQAERLR